MVDERKKSVDRKELENWIGERYGVAPDNPWPRYPDNAVYRHGGNRKWFALVMSVAAEKLGLRQTGQVDVVNLKCDPILQGSLLTRPGIFPAYHMNKVNWISVALDGSVDGETVKALVEASYDATWLK